MKWRNSSDSHRSERRHVREVAADVLLSLQCERNGKLSKIDRNMGTPPKNEVLNSRFISVATPM
jgi:hypothetical protein